MKPRELLLAKAKKYRESIERNTVTITQSEFRHLTQLLDDAADILESYSAHEEFSHEIRETVAKIKGGTK